MPLENAGFYNKRIVAANNIDLTGATDPDETMLLDGQLLIAHTALNANLSHIDVGKITSPLGTLTVGYSSPNITIDLSANFTWIDVTTATQLLAVHTGYLTDRGAGVTYTLPASAVIGDEIRIVGKLGITTIAQNAGQQILMSSASSTVGVTGTVVGTNVGDCIDLICITAGASCVFRAANFVGNWTVS